MRRRAEQDTAPASAEVNLVLSGAYIQRSTRLGSSRGKAAPRKIVRVVVSVANALARGTKPICRIYQCSVREYPGLVLAYTLMRACEASGEDHAQICPANEEDVLGIMYSNICGCVELVSPNVPTSYTPRC